MGGGYRGRKRPEDVNKKTSESLKRYFRNNPEAKRTIRKKGSKLTEEHKRRISESSKGKIISPEQREKIRRTLKRKYVDGSMFPISMRNTSIEIAIEKQLKENGIEYIPQKYIKCVGFVDFFIPSVELIIECDGDYWHSLKGMKERDADRDFIAKVKYGYRTLRLREWEINKSAETCFNKIARLL